MALERFADGTQHMITFDVLSHSSPVGNKGERMRLFLSENGYQKALESQSREECKILITPRYSRALFSMTSKNRKSDDFATVLSCGYFYTQTKGVEETWQFFG